MNTRSLLLTVKQSSWNGWGSGRTETGSTGRNYRSWTYSDSKTSWNTILYMLSWRRSRESLYPQFLQTPEYLLHSTNLFYPVFSLFFSAESPSFPTVSHRLFWSGQYGVTQNAIAVAWIMRHPAGIQTIVGSTNLKRIQDISKASDIVLSREEWYEIYLAAGKMLP